MSLRAPFLKIGLIALIACLMLLSGTAEQFFTYFNVQQLVAVLAVQPIIFIGLVLQGVRHAVLIDRPNLSYLAATKSVALSQGFNLFLPARLSEVLKATYLRDRASVSMSIGLSAVLLERTADLIIIGLLGFACFFFFAPLVSKALVLAFLLLATMIVSVALWGSYSILALARALPWHRIGGFVERTYLHFAATLKDRVFFRSLWLGLIIWAISFLSAFLLLSVAGDIKIGVYGVLLVFVCTTVGGAVPALPAGLGTYEAAAVFALTSLGYSFADALVLAVTLHSAQLVLPLILTLAIILTERLGILSLIADLRANAPPSDA